MLRLPLQILTEDDRARIVRCIGLYTFSEVAVRHGRFRSATKPRYERITVRGDSSPAQRSGAGIFARSSGCNRHARARAFLPFPFLIHL